MYSIFQINVVTQRGFVPVDERMQVIDANGNLVSCKLHSDYKFSRMTINKHC